MKNEVSFLKGLESAKKQKITFFLTLDTYWIPGPSIGYFAFQRSLLTPKFQEPDNDLS